MANEFDETKHPRGDGTGRFVEKPQMDPGVGVLGDTDQMAAQLATLSDEDLAGLLDKLPRGRVAGLVTALYYPRRSEIEQGMRDAGCNPILVDYDYIAENALNHLSADIEPDDDRYNQVIAGTAEQLAAKNFGVQGPIADQVWSEVNETIRAVIDDLDLE